MNDAHVFISSGENVRLSCNNALHDCKSTTWIYNRFSYSATVELIHLGIKNNVNVNYCVTFCDDTASDLKDLKMIYLL